MKRFNFLSMAIVAILMVAAVGCTTLTESQDDRYSRTMGTDRIYVDDPYRGTIVLERDPFSGRYYEVNSYNIYNDRYRRGYGRYDNRYYGRNVYRGRNTNTTPQRPPTQEQIRETQKNKDEARQKVLGGN
jgi:hypothetical protein